MTRRHLAGFIILHVIAAVALYAGWRAGLIQMFYASDSYYLATVLTGYAGYGLVCVLCGLLGTVVGFSIALGGIMSGENEARDAGLQMALNTTIVGLIGSQWLQECQRRLCHE